MKPSRSDCPPRLPLPRPRCDQAHPIRVAPATAWSRAFLYFDVHDSSVQGGPDAGAGAQLLVEVPRRMRERFEQARDMMGLLADQEALEPEEGLAQAALPLLMFRSRGE